MNEQEALAAGAQFGVGQGQQLLPMNANPPYGQSPYQLQMQIDHLNRCLAALAKRVAELEESRAKDGRIG